MCQLVGKILVEILVCFPLYVLNISPSFINRALRKSIDEKNIIPISGFIPMPFIYK